MIASFTKKIFFSFGNNRQYFVSRRAQFKHHLLREAAVTASKKTGSPSLPSIAEAPRPLLSPEITSKHPGP